jgi:hypothetical protein
MGEPSMVTHMGNSLDRKYELVLVKFLQENRGIFTWKPTETDLPRVPRELIEHEQHLDPKAKSVKQ